MATQKYASVPAKTLEVDLAVADTTLIIDNILDWNGTALTTAQFAGDYIPATLINDAKTKVEFILIDASTIASAATTGATIFKRGLPLYATGVVAADQTEVTANKLDWTSGETKVLLGTNAPYLYGTFPNRYNDELISGSWQFLNTNIPALDSYVAPTADAEFASKKYVDDVAAGGTASIDRIVPAATAGETIAAGDLIYNDDTANEWLLCDADTATTVEQVQLGIAQGAGTNGNPIAGGVLLWGLDSNQTGMTAGDKMFAGNTAGAITSSAGTTERVIGKAHSATQLFFDPFYFHTIKELDKDLLEAITADAAEINKLDGWTGTQGDLTEMSTFFQATDATGAEMETLTDGSNADSLHSHTMSTKLEVITTDVAISNSSVKTDLISVSIPGGTLGTNSAIKYKIYFASYLNNGGGSGTLYLRYGSTDIKLFTLPSGATSYSGWIEGMLLASGATGTQDGSITFDGASSTATTNAYVAGDGTATEDSTGALDLKVQLQFSTASPSNTITMKHAILEII